MKKIISLILTLATAITMFSLPVSAASTYAPKPKVTRTYYDGYTKVTITNSTGSTIRYTADGSKPTSASTKLKNKTTTLKFNDSSTLRLRVYKKGYKTVIYKFKITVKTAAKTTSANATAFEKAVNDVTLTPVTSGHELDDYVAKAIKEATTSDMTTYQKIKACYNWLVNNIEYYTASTVAIQLDYNMLGMASEYDYYLYEQAMYAFKNKRGVCDNFACAFVAICRAIGVEAYWASGECKSSKGGYTPHSWAVISAGGEIYQFDPMLDASTAQKNNLKSSYQYFERDSDTDLYRNRELISFDDFSTKKTYYLIY